MVPASGGVSPSGKATVFGIVIPRFESWHPSQIFSLKNMYVAQTSGPHGSD